MLQRIFRFIGFSAIILAVSSCGEAGGLQVQLNEEFVLAIGQIATIARENLVIEFKEVTEDSRCPKGATCVWSGEATCEVEIKRAGSSSRLALTEPGLSNGYTRQRYREYEFTFRINPYPEVGKTIPANSYRLHLIVTKLPSE